LLPPDAPALIGEHIFGFQSNGSESSDAMVFAKHDHHLLRSLTDKV
jgi:hypothetical protein